VSGRRKQNTIKATTVSDGRGRWATRTRHAGTPQPQSRTKSLASRRPEAICGEPDDVGVDRDLDDGVAGAVVWPAGADGEHAGQGLMPGAGGEPAQPVLLARDPGAGAQGLVDGAGGCPVSLDLSHRQAVDLGGSV